MLARGLQYQISYALFYRIFTSVSMFIIQRKVLFLSVEHQHRLSSTSLSSHRQKCRTGWHWTNCVYSCIFLQVENLLVVGHSCCGGIKALMSLQDEIISRFCSLFCLALTIFMQLCFYTIFIRYYLSQPRLCIPVASSEAGWWSESRLGCKLKLLLRTSTLISSAGTARRFGSKYSISTIYFDVLVNLCHLIQLSFYFLLSIQSITQSKRPRVLHVSVCLSRITKIRGKHAGI